MVCNGLAQSWVDNPMGAIGVPWQVATMNLVWSLCACLYPVQPMSDREIDSLVVAGLEVQAIMVFQTTPVAPEQSIITDEVQRTRDPSTGALAHNQGHAVGKALVQ